MTIDGAALADGAHNLIAGCAGLSTGDEVLIVAEDPSFGWYDAATPQAIANTAASLGMKADIIPCGAPTNSRDSEVFAAVKAAQNVIFMARIGDQDRFDAVPKGSTRTMVYTRTAAQLASLYGRTPHASMVQLKQSVDRIMGSGEVVTVTCPLGTQVSGRPAPTGPCTPADTTVRRFPMGVPAPTLADAFSGEVVLARYLTPTGSRTYDPPSCALPGPITAEIANARLVELRGSEPVVEAAKAHYANIAGQFGIDADAVHSFHAGIHPAVDYASAIADDPDRWSNSVFTHPRVLHFHTCGAYAPGEICWMIIDPTVTVGNVVLWDAGRLNFAALCEAEPSLSRAAGLGELFNAAPGNPLGHIAR